MKLLSLLRHATASPDGADDHSRALDEKGKLEAIAIAARLHASSLTAPGLILTSDARRARDTAHALHTVFHQALLVSEPALYLASSGSILDAVMTVDDRHEHVVIIGHNPGIGELADDLGGHAHPLIANGFAPATLATFECHAACWNEIGSTNLAFKNVMIP